MDPRFFCTTPLPRFTAPGIEFDVGEDITRHLQVLRLAAGDAVVLFDGGGGEVRARIASIGKRDTRVLLESCATVERESNLQITLVQALASGDKMDFIVQKAVELGVAAVQPVSSERATLKLAAERAQKRVQHWRAVAIAACEQCGRNRVPAIAEVISLEEWLPTTAAGTCLMLHPESGEGLLDGTEGRPTLSLLVGPEGGFSAREMALAERHGVRRVRFGPRILRAETAGLAALAALGGRFGDLR